MQFRHGPAAVSADESLLTPLGSWAASTKRPGKARRVGRCTSQKTCRIPLINPLEETVNPRAGSMPVRGFLFVFIQKRHLSVLSGVLTSLKSST